MKFANADIGTLETKNKNIQKLFKPYIVKRKNGQCQVLIPLVELDDLCEEILEIFKKDKPMFCTINARRFKI